MKTIRVSKDISIKVYTRKDGYAVGAIQVLSKNNVFVSGAFIKTWVTSGGVVLMPDELDKVIAALKKAKEAFAFDRKAVK